MTTNISSILFDLIFIQTNDAYKNRLRQIILEGLKIGKGAVRCRPPVAPYVSTHLHITNTLFELSKPDESFLSQEKDFMKERTIDNERY
jgi:hypothetical protein